MRPAVIVTLLLILQVVCTLVFVGDILLGVLGVRLRPLPWEWREALEIGAAVGLMIGLALSAMLLGRMRRRAGRVEAQLRVASGAFAELLEDRFAEWGLTPAERDVALFVIKGLSTAEVARMRATSEGTVKAQTNAIYRKAAVTGRGQLVSLFIEDLMDGPIVPRAAIPPAPDPVAPDIRA